MEEYYPILILIAGALGGLIRNFRDKSAHLVYPVIDIKNRTIKLGFLSSILMGAVTAYLVSVGILSFFIEFEIQSLLDALLFGGIIGFAGTDILNTFLLRRSNKSEENEEPCQIRHPQKREIYARIKRELPDVERILIKNGNTAGTILVYVVPKNDVDPSLICTNVESLLKDELPLGIQAYVQPPEEVLVDIDLIVEMIGFTNGKKEEYQTGFENKIREYVDSLQPGSDVIKMRIVTEIMTYHPMVLDVRDDNFTSVPKFHHGRILIRKHQVARSGDISIKVITKSIADHQ